MEARQANSRVDSFIPHPLLRGGHVQTLAGNFLPRRSLLPQPEERLFQVEPDVQVMCHCHWQPERAARPTVMIVHGLEGSSNSQYVIGTGSRAWTLGWNVVRMNIRNCGGTETLGPTLYHSGLSADIRAVVSALVEEDRLERIALAGFSMGGNQVLKAVGEWGATPIPQLKAVAAISPACDLSISADVLHRMSNRVYEWWFLRGLYRRFRRKAELFPGHYDVKLLGKVASIREFDEHITARYMGFAGAEDYYAKASAATVVEHISVPTLVVHAADDPFIVMTPETEAKLRANPNITYIHTEHGGHCAFVAERNGGEDDGRWAERQLINFVAEHA